MEDYYNGNTLIDRTGEEHTTNQGYKITIKEYTNVRNVIVVFENGYEVKVKYSNVKRGMVNNPYRKSVANIGFIGVGKYNSVKDKKAFTTWSNMIKRCYSEQIQEKQPCYIGCSVAEEWHNFQNFAKWFYENYNPETMQDWQLDKDVLIKGNKIYSPETCVFLPQEINNAMTIKKHINKELPLGVRQTGNKFYVVFNKKYLGIFNTPDDAFYEYITERDKYFNMLAYKWKKLIDKKAFESLVNYKTVN